MARVKKSAGPDQATIEILRIATGRVDVCILGRTPFICNRMSEKVLRELLLPRGRLTSAQKQQNLKHDPLAEYRASPYQFHGDEPTRIFLPGGSFKKAAMQAAIDMGGATKASIGRLLWVEPRNVPLYGIPQLSMATPRLRDFDRTPDVRTRAILPEWACQITVNFVKPNLGLQQVTNLFAAAGLICGVGDWRQEKGSGNHGQFELAAQDDPRFVAIVQGGGRAAQDAALAKPVCFDEESEALYDWFHVEARRRDKMPTEVAQDGEGDAADLPEEVRA